MSTFDHLQRKSPLASNSVRAVPSLLQPSRPFAPLAPSPSRQGAPDTQAPLQHTRHLDYSIDRIPIFPPAKKNTTGLPDALKTSVEKLSGISLDDVQVHYASSQPEQVQALAYAQGNDIHLALGQEQHLAHETWHVVQQKQGRVTPTIQAWGQPINDDQRLEQEADKMGKKAASAATMAQAFQVREAGNGTGYTKRTLVPKTIQRLGPDLVASAPGLVAVYNSLLHSAEFQKLNQIVTTNKDIILQDSSDMHAADYNPNKSQDVSYNPTNHRIRVPLNNPAGVARPLPDVRMNILWEMHNARSRGAHKRTALKFPVPGRMAPREEVERFLEPYNLAARALSKEWDEWIRVAEHDIRTVRINQEPAVIGALGANAVARRYGGHFANPGQGWYNFANYLMEQIHTGHTNDYDPDAAKDDWKGLRIVKTVSERSAAALIITANQVDNWQMGKTTNIKAESNNPFKSQAIIKEASWRDY